MTAPAGVPEPQWNVSPPPGHLRHGEGNGVRGAFTALAFVTGLLLALAITLTAFAVGIATAGRAINPTYAPVVGTVGSVAVLALAVAGALIGKAAVRGDYLDQRQLQRSWSITTVAIAVGVAAAAGTVSSVVVLRAQGSDMTLVPSGMSAGWALVSIAVLNPIRNLLRRLRLS
jgi:hypothetical protein